MRKKSMLCIGVLFFVCFVIGLWYGKMPDKKKENLLEEITMLRLSECMEEDAPKEALKAMAILLRTQLQAELEAGAEPLEGRNLGAKRVRAQSPYRLAADQTRGLILTYEGMAAKLAYHEISAGQTRGVIEEWAKEKYPNLLSVECVDDLQYDEYLTEVLISKEDFLRKLLRFIPGAQELQVDILERDYSGYVRKVLISGNGLSKVIGGEMFRTIIGLPSAHFLMEVTRENILFTCRGRGHGFGLSICEALSLAQQGKTDLEILNYFFQNIVLMRIA